MGATATATASGVCCFQSWTITLLYFSLASFFFSHYCEARISKLLLSNEVSHPQNQYMKHLKILELAKNLNMLMDVSLKDASNADTSTTSSSSSSISSPITLPPYDSLPPFPLPDTNNTPPFCVYPPPTTTTTIPTPPQQFSPNPPIVFPGPPGYAPNPPYYEPSPPSGTIPSPPEYVPSPIGFQPSPPLFEPPVVYPPPTVPPPPSSSRGGRGPGVWCVAKPAVPDPILQEAMNYACGSGADCGPLQPNGSCYQPDTLLEHASYAFNSYWQRTKVAGGTCSFGGTAILVTVDPSSQGCRFENY